MGEKFKGPEIIDLNEYEFFLEDMPVAELEEAAMEMITQGGGGNVHRLIAFDAEVRLLPKTIGARMNEAESKSISKNMKNAFHELGGLSGSKYLAYLRGKALRPFTVVFTSSRIRPEGVAVVAPTTSANVIRAHRDAFNQDEETQKLLKCIMATKYDDRTRTSLVMEIPDMKMEELGTLQSMLNEVNAEYDCNLSAGRIDLSSALQSAIAKTKQGRAGMRGEKIAILSTDAIGPNGGEITLISVPDLQIQIRETEIGIEQEDTPDTKRTKIIVERPFLAT